MKVQDFIINFPNFFKYFNLRWRLFFCLTMNITFILNRVIKYLACFFKKEKINKSIF